jgi:uncharacterized protein YjbI with pentapeptide repeats
MERAMAKKAVEIPVTDGRREALEKQAQDLGEARKALDSATGIARGLWFTFLSLTAYLVVSVGSVTHRELFLETPVRLPLLNVDLPLVTFFWVAPLMFLVIHAYLLLNLKFMSDNAQHYFDEVDRTGLETDVKQKLFLQLSNFLILQMLIVRRQEKWGIMGFATHFVVVLTVMIAPILVLLLIQLQFLPYHSDIVTGIHRLAIVADMGLLMFFWHKIAGEPANSRVSALRHAVWAVVFVIVLFSGFVATFPGELGRENSVARLSGMARYLFHSPVHQVKGKRERWFSDTLVLTDADFVNLDDDKLPSQITVSLRGRDLAGAFLARTDLRRADFTGAELSGANFRDAKLQGAQFGCPLIRVEHGEKSLSQCTMLNNAILDGADMRGAYMRQASLQNASLLGVQLDEANLEGTLLQGALFKDSSMAKINMWKANLTGAKFENSDMSGARLVAATLAGTILHGVTMRGGDLTDAKLQAPALINVNVLDVKADKADWTTALAQDIKVTDAVFVLNQPVQGLNSIVSAAREAPGGGEFSVAGADPEPSGTKGLSVLAAISRSAVISRGPGGTEADPARWEPRRAQLRALLCANKADPLSAIEVFERLRTLPGSDKDPLLAFGPDRKEFIDILFDGKECANAAALKQNACDLLQAWSARGSKPRAECEK